MAQQQTKTADLHLWAHLWGRSQPWTLNCWPCPFSISLEVMTLNPVCEHVETSEGVPLTVTGVAQCKIMTEPELLNTACEQFLGKSVDHIERVILQTLEGHLRAILGQCLVIEAMTLLGCYEFVNSFLRESFVSVHSCYRHPERGSHLSRQGPVCPACQGSGCSRCWSHGHWNPELHH